MKIIAPMAGTGQRFVDSGYKEPKPLIEVNGKKIIQYIIEMFSPDDDFVFICNEKHLAETNMKDVLQELCPDSVGISMPLHKLGPVYTVQQAYDFIDDDEEVIITYCDNPYIWDREDFLRHIREKDLDGCVLSHSGFHPHTLNNTKMAFMKTNGDLVEEIKEKECYTDDPMNEHASTGTYYFKKGSYVKKYFKEAMEKNVQYNGEFYVTLVYNLLIQDGLRVGFYDTPFATVMGTPEEVENIEAWNSIINKGQVKSEEDLLKCYRYWRLYHDSDISQRKS
tara:strand:- start:2210 stop:3049 length:840 start_codon:yes stop_codon:yes gene_type:complete